MANEGVFLTNCLSSSAIPESSDPPHKTLKREDTSSREIVISSIRPGMKREFSMIMELNKQTGALSMDYKRKSVQKYASSVTKTTEFKRKTCRKNKISNTVKKAGRGTVDAQHYKEAKHGYSTPKVQESSKLRNTRDMLLASKGEMTPTSNSAIFQGKRTNKMNKNGVPVTFKHLLKQGDLKGKRVGYARGGKSRETQEFELEGVIGDLGIQCTCATCATKKISSISPSLFEKHAGSAYRKPFENIYLIDSKKRLRDVMNAGGSENSDSLPKVMLKAIAPPNSSSIQREDIPNGGHENTKHLSNDSKITLCYQCEKEYHVDPVNENGIYDLKDLPEGIAFCSRRCWDINSTLRKRILEGEQQLPEGFRKKLGPNITWKLFSGNVEDHSPSTKNLIPRVIRLFREQFEIIDLESNRDLISPMVSGSELNGQDFHGMYCAVLMDRSRLLSAAIFRVFGEEIAELPVVATKSSKVKKGYWRALFSCINDFLKSLKVKSLVLPPTETAESMWIDKFHFKKLDEKKIDEYKSKYQQLQLFSRPTLLHKYVDEA